MTLQHLISPSHFRLFLYVVSLPYSCFVGQSISGFATVTARNFDPQLAISLQLSQSAVWGEKGRQMEFGAQSRLPVGFWAGLWARNAIVAQWRARRPLSNQPTITRLGSTFSPSANIVWQNRTVVIHCFLFIKAAHLLVYKYCVGMYLNWFWIFLFDWSVLF